MNTPPDPPYQLQEDSSNAKPLNVHRLQVLALFSVGLALALAAVYIYARQSAIAHPSSPPTHHEALDRPTPTPEDPMNANTTPLPPSNDPSDTPPEIPYPRHRHHIDLHAVHMSGDVALAVGNNGTILRSEDRGETWTVVNP